MLMTEGSGRARLLLEAQRERGLTAQEDNVDDLEEELARRHTARSVNRTEQDCFPQQGQGERQGKSAHTLDAHKLWKKAAHTVSRTAGIAKTFALRATEEKYFDAVMHLFEMHHAPQDWTPHTKTVPGSKSLDVSGPQGGIGQWRPKPTGEDSDLNQSSSESEESVEDFSVEIFKLSSKTPPPQSVTHSSQMKSAAPASKGKGTGMNEGAKEREEEKKTRQTVGDRQHGQGGAGQESERHTKGASVPPPPTHSKTPKNLVGGSTHNNAVSLGGVWGGSHSGGGAYASQTLIEGGKDLATHTHVPDVPDLRSSATAITMSASARAAASTVVIPATPASPALPSSAPHDYSATCMLQGWRDEDEQSGVVSEWGGSPDVRGLPKEQREATCMMQPKELELRERAAFLATISSAKDAGRARAKEVDHLKEALSSTEEKIMSMREVRGVKETGALEGSHLKGTFKDSFLRGRRRQGQSQQVQPSLQGDPLDSASYLSNRRMSVLCFHEFRDEVRQWKLDCERKEDAQWGPWGPLKETNAPLESAPAYVISSLALLPPPAQTQVLTRTAGDTSSASRSAALRSYSSSHSAAAASRGRLAASAAGTLTSACDAYEAADDLSLGPAVERAKELRRVQTADNAASAAACRRRRAAADRLQEEDEEAGVRACGTARRLRTSWTPPRKEPQAARSPLPLLKEAAVGGGSQRLEEPGTDAGRDAPPPPLPATPTVAAATAASRAAAAAAPKALEAADKEAGVPYIISGASPGQPHGAPARLFKTPKKEAVCFALSGRALASTEHPPRPLTSGAPRARASASLPHFRRRSSLLSAGLLKALALAREPSAAREPSTTVLALGASEEEEEEEGEEERRRSVTERSVTGRGRSLWGVNHVTVSVRSPKAPPATYTPLPTSYTHATCKAPAGALEVAGALQVAGVRTLRLLHFRRAPTSSADVLAKSAARPGGASSVGGRATSVERAGGTSVERATSVERPSTCPSDVRHITTPNAFTFQLSAHPSTHPLSTAATPLGGACSPCTHSPRAQRVRPSAALSHEPPHIGPQAGGPRRGSVGDGLLMHMGVKQHNREPMTYADNRDPICLGLATPRRTRPPPPPAPGMPTAPSEAVPADARGSFRKSTVSQARKDVRMGDGIRWMLECASGVLVQAPQARDREWHVDDLIQCGLLRKEATPADAAFMQI